MIVSSKWKLRSNLIAFDETRDREDHKYSNTNCDESWEWLPVPFRTMVSYAICILTTVPSLLLQTPYIAG